MMQAIRAMAALALDATNRTHLGEHGACKGVKLVQPSSDIMHHHYHPQHHHHCPHLTESHRFYLCLARTLFTNHLSTCSMCLIVE